MSIAQTAQTPQAILKEALQKIRDECNVRITTLDVEWDHPQGEGKYKVHKIEYSAEANFR